MVKKSRKRLNVKKPPEQVVDNYAKILQIVAIIAVIALIFIDAAFLPTTDVPIWVIGGLMGIAIGLSPEQMVEIIKGAISGVKKK